MDNNREEEPAELPQFQAQILVADDNFTNQEVARFLLEDFGLSADFVNNGEEALKALEKISYNLVFMDCQMPVMDGFEATRAIRAGDSGRQNHEIPIIAMTANAQQSDRESCYAAGMSDFIAKPVDIHEVQRVLLRWLPESTHV